MEAQHSVKLLHSMPSDPMMMLNRQLKQSGAVEGDYVSLVDLESGEQLIYKVSSVTQTTNPLPPQNVSTKKSILQSDRDNSMPDNKLVNEGIDRYRLAFGSQIFLKNMRGAVRVEVLRAFFPCLWVQIKLKNQGFIHLEDDKISIAQGAETQGLWMCKVMIDQPRVDGRGQEVCFCNFVDKSWLYLETTGVLSVTTEDKATRFTVSQTGTGSYALRGRNVLSQMVRNKSKQEIRKIIDSSIQRAQSQVNSTGLEIELQIIPFEDNLIAIHNQINFSRKALATRPSLRLALTTLNELIFYDISEFVRDYSLLSEHIQKLLLDYDIFSHIAHFLIERQSTELMIQSPLKLPKKQESKQSRSKDYVFRQPSLTELLRPISVLCRQSVKVAEVFLPLVGSLIEGESYEEAGVMLTGNQFFMSQFHKAGWYAMLQRMVSRSPKRLIAPILSFLKQFCQQEDPLTIFPSRLDYRLRPSTNNRHLLFHTINAQGYSTQILQYQLYIEGIYVFVHDNRTGKDTELNTFIEGNGPSSISTDNNRGGRSELTNNTHPPTDEEVDLLLAQIRVIEAICHEGNPYIIPHYQPLINALSPYCYKENFPQVQAQALKRLIIKLVSHTGPSPSDISLHNHALIGYAMTEAKENPVKSASQVSQPKEKLQSLKNMRKQSQITKKILREMGGTFLRRVKQWASALKKKTLTVRELLEQQGEGGCLVEWMVLMLQVFKLKILKVREKQEGQLMSYIKKIFEAFEEDKQEHQDDSSGLVGHLLQVLIEIIKFHPKSQVYLHHLKAKRNYQGKFRDQINKVISNLQNKNQVRFDRRQKGLSKLELIDIVSRRLERQELSQSGGVIGAEQGIIRVKIIATRVIQTIILNFNSELVEESLETLNYLIKHPSNFSSFSLTETHPKYPNESQMKRILLQQFYLTSNRTLLKEYLNLQRLIYHKKYINRESLNQFLLIDNPSTFRHYLLMQHPVSVLTDLTNKVQSWLRAPLLQKQSDVYEAYLSELTLIGQALKRLNEVKNQEDVCKIIENMGLLHTCLAMLQYLAPFFIEKDRQSKTFQTSSRVAFKHKGDHFFVENRLVPLAQGLLKILQYYLQNAINMGMTRVRVFLHSFGQLLAKVQQYVPFLMRIYQRALSSHEDELVDLLKSTPNAMLIALFKMLPLSQRFFRLYTLLSQQSLTRQMTRLYSVAIEPLTQQEQAVVLQSFLEPLIAPPSGTGLMHEDEGDYDFSHQVTLLTITCKLLYAKLLIPFTVWFRDKLFWLIVQDVISTSSQKFRQAQLNYYEVKRRQFILEAGYLFRAQYTSESVSRARMMSELEPVRSEEGEEVNTLLAQYCMAEIEFSREVVESRMRNNDSVELELFSDIVLLEYLEFVVCDVTIVGYQLEVLGLGDLTEHLRFCYQQLREVQKHQVTDRTSPETVNILPKIEQILEGRQPTFTNPNPRRLSLPRASNLTDTSTRSRAPRSRPIRKWQKALAELNKEKFLNKQTHFMQDIVDFDDIYELKNEEEINLVINQNDILMKLVEVTVNADRLTLPIETTIFLLEEMEIVAAYRARKKKHVDEGLVRFGVRLLEGILEEELGSQREGHHWHSNPYCLALKMLIVQHSRCLWLTSNQQKYGESLAELLELSAKHYQQDLLFFESFFQTSQSRQIQQTLSTVLPFDTILAIISSEFFLDKLTTDQDYVLYGRQIVKAYYWIDFQGESWVRKYEREDLKSIVGDMSKPLWSQLLEEMKQEDHYKHLMLLEQ